MARYLCKLRSQVAGRIKPLVASLKIAAAGARPIMDKLIKSNEAMTAGAATQKLFVESIKATEHPRYFQVTFKGGNWERRIPAEEDPLVLEAGAELDVFLSAVTAAK